MGLGGLMDKAKTATSESAAGAKVKAIETTNKTLAEISALEHVLRNCGFIIGDIKVTMSIPPGITIILEQIPASSESLESLAQDQELTKVQTAIVEGLRRAYAMEDMVKEHNMTIGQVEIEMTFPPKVHVHLNSQQSRAFG